MSLERAIAPDPLVVIKADAGSAKVAAGPRLERNGQMNVPRIFIFAITMLVTCLPHRVPRSES